MAWRECLWLARFVVVLIGVLSGLAISAEPSAAEDIVEDSIRTPIQRRYLKVVPTGNEYFVSTEGKDSNPGTCEEPFRTIQHFANMAGPGDTCFVREGTYRETVRPKRSGIRRNPIVYVAYPGERVTLSGTEVLQGDWKLYKDSIYQLQVEKDFEQLFVDGEMMVEARWPNRPFEKLWERSTWATSDKGSKYGKMVDAELAKTGIDWTGATATLNVAHQFFTWTRQVTHHTAGSDTFEYPKDMDARLSGTAHIDGHWQNDYYYLSGKLEALDSPSEWFYEKSSQTLYLWCPDGENPAEKSVEIKVRDHVFEVQDLDEIHLIGFHFFGATFHFENTVHSLVDGCHLLYPTYSRDLTDLAYEPQPAPRTSLSGSHNTIRNCSLAYTPLSGLVMTGAYNTLHNNLIHDVCWNGSLRYPAVSVTGGERPGDRWNPSFIKGNTVYNAGSAGIGFRHQATQIEYNYVHHVGLMSHDVAAIYTGGDGIAGSVVSYNWVHNCHPEIENGKNIGLGIRADDQSRNISVHHNVVWDVGLDAIILKGEYHKLYNNTVFHTKPIFRFGNSIRLDTEPEPYKAWRVDAPLYSEQNAHTLVFNNLVGLIRAEYKKETPFVHASNAFHNHLNYEPSFKDRDGFDFRPQEGAKTIDAGRALPGITDHYLGSAPDVGAYEAGAPNWRPGYQARPALYYRMNKVRVDEAD